MKIDTSWENNRTALVGIIILFAMFIASRLLDVGIFGGFIVGVFLGGLTLHILDKIIPTKAKNPLKLKQEEKDFLENKAWYRVFKVISWTSIVVLVAIVAISLFAEGSPKTTYIPTGEYVYDTDPEWNPSLDRQGGVKSCIDKWAEIEGYYKKEVEHCPDGARKYAEIQKTQQEGSWAEAIIGSIFVATATLIILWIIYATLRRSLIYIIYKEIK